MRQAGLTEKLYLRYRSEIHVHINNVFLHFTMRYVLPLMLIPISHHIVKFLRQDRLTDLCNVRVK